MARTRGVGGPGEKRPGSERMRRQDEQFIAKTSGFLAPLALFISPSFLISFLCSRFALFQWVSPTLLIIILCEFFTRQILSSASVTLHKLLANRPLDTQMLATLKFIHMYCVREGCFLGQKQVFQMVAITLSFGWGKKITEMRGLLSFNLCSSLPAPCRVRTASVNETPVPTEKYSSAQYYYLCIPHDSSGHYLHHQYT